MTKQLSVFLENRAGRVNTLLEILKENDINILSMTIADTGEFGVVRMITDDIKKALNALNDAGMLVSETRVIAIEVLDEAGGLYDATKLLSENDINIEYMYSAVRSAQGRAVIIMRVDDISKAEKIISEHENGVRLTQIK